jgi:prepilin-type N-terminal cleavage/methylation domain-containing protein
MERQKKARRVGVVRPAFTLVELLVVITIIGMLMALLIPAIGAAKEQARRAQCVENLHNVGLALANYESSHKTYPGWRNTVTTGTSGSQLVSWPTMLLPNLERQDLWQSVKSGGSVTGSLLKVFSCPSDPPIVTQGTPSGYFIQGTGPSNYIANGLVLRDSATGSTTPPLTKDYVSANDGTTTTLMLGENTQTPPISAPGATSKAHNWWDVTSTIGGITPQLAQTFGYPIGYSGLTNYASVYGTQLGAYNGNTMLAVMNSAHNGGSNVVYFDDHAGFLSDTTGVNIATNSTTSQTVFQLLVTPDGSKVGGEPPVDESQIQ